MMKRVKGGATTLIYNGKKIDILDNNYIDTRDFEILIGALKLGEGGYDMAFFNGTLDLNSWDNPTVLKKLIRSGALDANAETSYHNGKKTNLILGEAAYHGCLKIFKMLLKHGADPNRRDKFYKDTKDKINEGKEDFISSYDSDGEEYDKFCRYLIIDGNWTVYDEMLRILDDHEY